MRKSLPFCLQQQSANNGCKTDAISFHWVYLFSAFLNQAKMLIYFFLQKILCKRMRREEGKSLKNCVSRELSGNSRRFFVSSFAYTFFMSCSKCKLMWMGPLLYFSHFHQEVETSKTRFYKLPAARFSGENFNFFQKESHVLIN